VASYRLAPLRESVAWDLADRLERRRGLVVIADPGHACLLAGAHFVAHGCLPDLVLFGGWLVADHAVQPGAVVPGDVFPLGRSFLDIAEA
jgi:hypothetical protein